jgi:molecular chaperone GrpE (heat shock protein)
MSDPPEIEQTDAFEVKDRRHWMCDDEEAEDDTTVERAPSAVGDLRRRAEQAEEKLREYIDAFKQREREQDDFRARIASDVDRRVELQFGDLVGSLLETLDHLDLALTHAEGVAEAAPLAEGVAMARDRFVATLEENGIRCVRPDDQPFDPNVAEAIRVDPVDTPDLDGSVTETLRPGYSLGERVIRPARVAVGRYEGTSP